MGHDEDHELQVIQGGGVRRDRPVGAVFNSSSDTKIGFAFASNLQAENAGNNRVVVKVAYGSDLPEVLPVNGDPLAAEKVAVYKAILARKKHLEAGGDPNLSIIVDDTTMDFHKTDGTTETSIQIRWEKERLFNDSTIKSVTRRVIFAMIHPNGRIELFKGDSECFVAEELPEFDPRLSFDVAVVPKEMNPEGLTVAQMLNIKEAEAARRYPELGLDPNAPEHCRYADVVDPRVRAFQALQQEESFYTTHMDQVPEWPADPALWQGEGMSAQELGKRDVVVIPTTEFMSQVVQQMGAVNVHDQEPIEAWRKAKEVFDRQLTPEELATTEELDSEYKETSSRLALVSGGLR